MQLINIEVFNIEIFNSYKENMSKNIRTFRNNVLIICGLESISLMTFSNFLRQNVLKWN